MALDVKNPAVNKPDFPVLIDRIVQIYNAVQPLPTGQSLPDSQGGVKLM
ncbi:hypothetical protein SAMN06265375_101407 [Muriicola jejuensis]|nr:hypothetical protein SAMN06265375_101407 [Muriicola jejuensis]